MITILNLSPRKDGINDVLCQQLCDGLGGKDKTYQYIKLRDLQIKQCTNCRVCMKTPEDELGKCYLSDDMDALLKSILLSEKVILSSPVNCYDLPSIMRILLERMGVFCYWSNEMYSPKIRPISRKIKGMLITTSALPGLLVPVLTGVRKTFRLFAKPIGIRNIEYFHIGFKGRMVDMDFSEKDRRLVNKIVAKLAV